MSRTLPLPRLVLLLCSLTLLATAGCGTRNRAPGGPTPPGTDSGMPTGDGGMTDCTTDEDCADMASACGTATCNGGTCQIGMAAPDGTTCDDEDPCTSGDACTAGSCVGTMLDCTELDDGVCIVGSCNAATGACEAVPDMDGTVCDDGMVCTDGDTCAAGACSPGAALDCSAMTDMCNVGMCDETMGGCVQTPLGDGVGCDDGDPCTTGDACTAGTCAGTTLDCSFLDGMCTTGSCDPTTGACTANPSPDGTACDDSDACTRVDRCTGGMCTGTTPVDCSAMTDMCNTGTCSPATGACSAVPLPDGTACNDGDAMCTPGVDRCTAGVCTGTNVCCTPRDFRINEVAGGTPDFIEIINRGTCTLNANTVGLRWDGCDTSPLTYRFPSRLVPPGGVVRVVDTSAPRAGEFYYGSNMCHNPTGEIFVQLCEGACSSFSCANVIDYFEQQSSTGTRPVGGPACATFSPAPFSSAGMASTQSATRISFVGSGAAGLRSDYAIRTVTR